MLGLIIVLKWKEIKLSFFPNHISVLIAVCTATYVKNGGYENEYKMVSDEGIFNVWGITDEICKNGTEIR